LRLATIRTLGEMTMTSDPATDNSTDWAGLARKIGSELRPEVADRDISGHISGAAFERLRASGVTSALVPVEFGGGGASHVEMGAVLRELGRYDPATAVTLSMHAHLVATQVWRHHHGVDAEKVFRKVTDDHAILISTGASDWVGSNGSAKRVDGGFRVSALKAPASGCEVGQILVTSIRWDDAPDGPHVIHCSVPFSADGVSIELTWDTLGLRATGSHTIVLDDVFVPDAAVSLTRSADGWPPIWNTVLGSAMPLIMSAYLGIADSAVEIACTSVSGRSDPHVSQLLGEMVNAHTTAADVITAMFVDSDNLRFENTDAHASRTLSRKTVATDALIDAVRLALEVSGGIGYTRGSPIERLYRDIHGCLFHPLPRAKQTNFTGRVALGMSPMA
jgi:acyl-CoA dehydrogenase